MKANTKIFETPNYQQATEVWYNKMNVAQRLEVMNLFDIKSITKKFRACINHISQNIEQYA
jgi:hypothetical protein